MLERFSQLPLSGWFPGHMLKAGRDMHKSLQLIDFVVELLDARIPESSRNPALEDFLWTKPRLLVFNKTDLADPAATQAWRQWFRTNQIPALFVDAQHGKGIHELAPLVRSLWEAERQRRGATRPLVRPLRLMIVGIPNVGKSTLVNRVAERRKAAVGPKPGVTRSLQWVRLQDNLELLDTPGVLWPRINDKLTELKLAITGTIKDEVIGEHLIVEYLWAWLYDTETPAPWELYGLTACPPDVQVLLDAVGRRRGYLRPGGGVDQLQAAIALLNDYRAGRFGRLTFDPLPTE